MITFLRKSPLQKQLVIDYVDYALDIFKRQKKSVINEKVMTAIKMICNTKDNKYKDYILKLRDAINAHNYNKNIGIINNMFQFIENYSQEKLERAQNNYSDANKSDQKVNTSELTPEKLIQNDPDVQKALKVIENPSNKDYKDFIEYVNEKLVEYQKKKPLNQQREQKIPSSGESFEDGFEECG